MTRAAGNAGHYTWISVDDIYILRDNIRDELMPGVCSFTADEWLAIPGNELPLPEFIEYPSVTTIIGSVLAKPQLVNWAYKQTRDSIAGLVDHYLLDPEFNDELLEILSDSDSIDEWLKDNRARPSDMRDEAADRGHEQHGFLEELAKLEPEESYALAAANVTSTNMYTKAIAKWWSDTRPAEFKGEQVLVSLKHGFVGTCDLVWRRMPGLPWNITDLKTRRAGLYAYDSDFVQVDGYAEAWNEMTGETINGRSVLVAFDDGRPKEYPSAYPKGVFLTILAVYVTMLEGGRKWQG